MEITVITASINRESLQKTVQSVQKQILRPVCHKILFQQRMKRPVIDLIKPSAVPIEIHWLPWQPETTVDVYNIANEMADTEWIAMLDDDCWWTPGHLKGLALLAEKTGSDFVWSSSIIFHHDTGEVIGFRDESIPGPERTDTNEILFRRDCIERWGDYSMDDPDMKRRRGRGMDGARLERWVEGGAKFAHSKEASCYYAWRKLPERYHGELDKDGNPMPDPDLDRVTE